MRWGVLRPQSTRQIVSLRLVIQQTRWLSVTASNNRSSCLPQNNSIASRWDPTVQPRRRPGCGSTFSWPRTKRWLWVPSLRGAAESVLQEGETLSGFIEAFVRESIERRRTRAEFVSRALFSRDEAKRTGVYFAADAVDAELGKMLAKAKKNVRG